MGDRIRCVRIQRGHTHPVPPSGFTKIYPISANSKWGSLSPMKLGPFHIWDRGVQVKVENMERWWQASKIYSVDVKNGKLQPSFWQRRKEWFGIRGGARRVFPKSSGVTTIMAYHDGKFYNYLESRVYYCHVYSYLVEKSPAYLELEVMLLDGHKLAIYGYDGLPGGEKIELTPEVLDRAYRDSRNPFGHEQVLACMLIDYRPWLADIV
jgi:hypothetical protein